MFNLLKYQKTLIVFLVFSFIFSPVLVLAFDFGVFQAISAIIAKLFNWFASFFEWFYIRAAELATLALNPQKLFNQGLVGADIVGKGWSFVLSFTNLFFILVLLVIAFATILRIEPYGMKSILWKLIVAALIINFSLAIAGIFIDFSQVLSNYFIAGAGGENFGTYAVAKLGLKPGGAPNPDAPPPDPEKANSEPLWLVIQASIIRIIFAIFGTFIFLALAALFLVRVLALWVLLIISPIVWLFWILPKTETYFHKWWDAFMKWVFFAPVATFFLYLAVNVDLGLRDVEDRIPLHSLVPSILQPSNLANFIIVGGLMLASLIVAEKFAIPGASMFKGVAMGMAKGFGKKVSGVNMVGRYVDAVKGHFDKVEKQKKERAKERVEELRKSLTGIPGVGYFTKTPKEKQKEKAEDREKRAKEYIQKLHGENKTPQQIQEELRKGAGGWKGTKRFIPLAREYAARDAIALAELDKGVSIKKEVSLPKREMETIEQFEERMRNEGITIKGGKAYKSNLEIPIPKMQQETEDQYQQRIKKEGITIKDGKAYKSETIRASFGDKEAEITRKTAWATRKHKREMGEKSKKEKALESLEEYFKPEEEGKKPEEKNRKKEEGPKP